MVKSPDASATRLVVASIGRQVAVAHPLTAMPMLPRDSRRIAFPENWPFPLAEMSIAVSLTKCALPPAAIVSPSDTDSEI